LRGASAIEKLLSGNSDASLRVLVVWEPMLVTDWETPGRGTLRRISDQRARQFWDPDHLVAQELNRFVNAHPEQKVPACCFDKGFHWDESILYAPHSQWKDAPPLAFWNGPVWKAAPDLENALRASPR
jgi:hypothetical protein